MPDAPVQVGIVAHTHWDREWSNDSLTCGNAADSALTCENASQQFATVPDVFRLLADFSRTNRGLTVAPDPSERPSVPYYPSASNRPDDSPPSRPRQAGFRRFAASRWRVLRRRYGFRRHTLRRGGQ